MLDARHHVEAVRGLKPFVITCATLVVLTMAAAGTLLVGGRTALADAG
ncbi:hypothetical protein BH20ACT5_BH20ACT5_02430 [soil metagenome]